MASFKDMMNAQVLGTDKIKSAENYLTDDYSDKACAACGIKHIYRKYIGDMYILPDGRTVNRSDAERWLAAKKARSEKEIPLNFIDLIA